MKNDPELGQIVERAKDYDQEALSLIYERYFNRIFRYALARVYNRETAEDLAGQTFLRLVERIADFEWRDGGFNAWLFRITHNLIIDWFRSRREIPAVESETAVDIGPEDAVLADETLREVLAAMDQINETQRQVLLLRLVAGLSGRETADTLGLSEENVRTLQHRALVAVRNKLRVKIDV